jgi:hypothetical protein
MPGHSYKGSFEKARSGDVHVCDPDDSSMLRGDDAVAVRAD